MISAISLDLLVPTQPCILDAHSCGKRRDQELLSHKLRKQQPCNEIAFFEHRRFAKKAHLAHVWPYLDILLSDIHAAVYDRHPSDTGEHARALVQGWKDKLVCDDLCDYNRKYKSGVTELHCMACPYRKLHDLYATHKGLTVLDLRYYLTKLCEIERKVQHFKASERQQIRKQTAVTMDVLHTWINEEQQLVSKGSDTGLQRECWLAQLHYIDDGKYRSTIIGVKTRFACGRLFARTRYGSKRAAALMLLIHTISSNEHDLYKHLRDVLRRSPTQKMSGLLNYCGTMGSCLAMDGVRSLMQNHENIFSTTVGLLQDENMRQDIIDYYEKIMYCKDENIFSELTIITKLLGFNYVSYVIQRPFPTVKPATYVLENHPKSWIDHYQKCSYLGIDPIIRLGRVKNQPFIWTDDLFEENQSTKNLRAEAKAHGLIYGISHPLWDTGGIFGLLSLNRAKKNISKLEVENLQIFFDCIGAILHRRISSQCLRGNEMYQIKNLTPKEQEVLRWSADGKTVPELAIIMNISERTVSFHVKNILEKLNVTSKIQAAVIMASINRL